jgi:hypothetical protein
MTLLNALSNSTKTDVDLTAAHINTVTNSTEA